MTNNETFLSIKTPFDTEARIAHKSLADEIVTELDLGADIEIWALEPPAYIVPQLRFAQERPFRP